MDCCDHPFSATARVGELCVCVCVCVDSAAILSETNTKPEQNRNRTETRTNPNNNDNDNSSRSIHVFIAAPRGRGWTPTDGLIGFRGLFIGSISSLTVFSFLRALRFRDTDVVAIQVLPRHVPLNGIQGPAMIQNAAEYGYRLDGKTGVVTTVIVSAAWLTLQLLVSLLTRRPTHFFFSRTYYVPLSAGSLWPQSLLHVFWYLPVTFSQDRRSSFFAAIRRSSSVAMVWKQLSVRLIETALLPSVKDSGCVICRQPTSALHWRMTQGCPQHEPIFRIDKRPREIWSAVRLVNTGLLSDPVVLFQIFVIGRPVFLYRFVLQASDAKREFDRHTRTHTGFHTISRGAAADSAANLAADPWRSSG
ncbi:hypothetical protein PINS_up007719 [Pythium insidiosum]|nr:hypothetical protein PINS_up007719 [Pythium insidiosum]